MGHEHEQDAWLHTTLRQTPGPAADGCVDAETLAAWADGGLTAQAAAAVELHASNCARCTAVLAAMERSAPAAPARHVWTPARLFRWVVPLTAAATAVAIWIAVPDRPIVPERSAAVRSIEVPQERGNTASEADARSADAAAPAPKPGALKPDTASGAGSRELQQSKRMQEPAQEQAQEQAQLRDEFRRERADAETLGATAAAPPAEAPSAGPAATPPSAPAPTAAPAAAADAAGRAFDTTARRSALNSTTVSIESVAPSNPLVRWRVLTSMAVERSFDGGKTWMKTAPPPGVAQFSTPAVAVAGIRAVDGDRAVVRMSDGSASYTTDGGVSWTRVQENSPAPF